MAVEKPWWWKDGVPSYYTQDYLAKKEVERRIARGTVGEIIDIANDRFWVEIPGDPAVGNIHAYCFTATWISALHFWRHPEGALRVVDREDCGRLVILPALKRAIDKVCRRRAGEYRVIYKRIAGEWHQWPA